MVYAVITNISYSSDTLFRDHEGTVRLVNKGEIPLPTTVNINNSNSYYNETYFSDYTEARANFELVVNNWQNSNGGRNIRGIDET